MISKSVHRSPSSFIRGLIASIETRKNKQIVIQISKSEQDIEDGKLRNARDFLNEF